MTYGIVQTADLELMVTFKTFRGPGREFSLGAIINDHGDLLRLCDHHNKSTTAPIHAVLVKHLSDPYYEWKEYEMPRNVRWNLRQGNLTEWGQTATEQEANYIWENYIDFHIAFYQV